MYKSGILKIICCFCLVLSSLFWGDIAQAGVLAERLASFPDWKNKPPVSAPVGDLVYPEWMQGTWNVTSTLVDVVAPLAPEVVTPGFEGNRQYLNQPINFQVRFEAVSRQPSAISYKLQNIPREIVADRVFNGLNIGKAYLGDRTVLSVKIEPLSPNRQITFLQGERQLVSVITGRGTENYPNKFITTEIYQQIFHGAPQLYFNTVETTTAYQLINSPLEIKADQITAIYLSPQDPNYFKAGERPVALYRYQLKLSPLIEFNPKLNYQD